DVLVGEITPAGDEYARSESLHHQSQIGDALAHVVAERLCDRVLQDHLVGAQLFLAQVHDPEAVADHRHDTYQDQHAQDDVQQRDAGSHGLVVRECPDSIQNGKGNL